MSAAFQTEIDLESGIDFHTNRYERRTPNKYFQSLIKLPTLNNVLQAKIDLVVNNFNLESFNNIYESFSQYDDSLSQHCSRTSEIVGQNYSSFSTLFYSQLRVAAFLHDIGKLCIDQNILDKKETLNPFEVDEIKLHSFYSFNILKKIFPANRTILNIALYHHEKWDGTGYPYGLKGKDIPIEARIFSIIDVWDAITSKRPYRDAIPVDIAISMMKGETFNGFFDPYLLNIFIQKKEKSITTSKYFHFQNLEFHIISDCQNNR